MFVAIYRREKNMKQKQNITKNKSLSSIIWNMIMFIVSFILLTENKIKQILLICSSLEITLCFFYINSYKKHYFNYFFIFFLLNKMKFILVYPPTTIEHNELVKRQV